MKYEVEVVKYGYATIEANGWEEAIEKLKEMAKSGDDSAFDWDSYLQPYYVYNELGRCCPV